MAILPQTLAELLFLGVLCILCTGILLNGVLPDRQNAATIVHATVTGHSFHRTHWCTRVVTLDDKTMEGACWGADLVVSWEAGSNCTLVNVLTETYTKSRAEALLSQHHAIGSVLDMYAIPTGQSQCALTLPDGVMSLDKWKVLVIMFVMLIATTGGLVVVTLLQWCLSSLYAWYQHRDVQPTAYGEGGTDKKTDVPLVLVASAPQP